MQDEQSQEPYDGLEHSRYMEMWREWIDIYGAARKQSFRDQEYYDGDVKGTGEGHWTKAELAVLGSRKQPPSVFNLVKRKINAILGVEQRSRAEPRGLPRTPKDQYAAEIATDAMRFVRDQARLRMVSASGFRDALIAGYGVSIVEGAEDSVAETHVEWRHFAFDPYSRAWDFSDAGWLAIGKWMDEDVAKAHYVPPEPERPQPPPRPEIPPQPMTDDIMALQQWALMAQAMIQRHQQEIERQEADYQAEVARRQKIIETIESTVNTRGGTGFHEQDGYYDDHPNDQFGDPKRKRLFVVDMWHKDPKHGWYRCVFTGSGKLFTEAASLIEKDRWGKKEKTHPIKAFSLYVSKDGWRYGEVRGMRSPQDEVNMRRSKALHLMTVRQVYMSPSAGIAEGDLDKLRREVARPDGVIVAQDISQIRVETNLDLAAGQQRLGEEARAFMELEGPNPQLQGEQGRATSGRAVLALQQAGLGQLGPVFDYFHDWEDRRYRAYWARIQQFWTGPMYVRVTDDKNAAKFAAVNGAVVYGDDGQPKRKPPSAGAAPMMPMPMGGPQGFSPNGMMMQPGGSDMMGMMMGGQGEVETGPMLAELDMDIIIDRAPEAATLQAEQFETMAQLAQSGVLPAGPETARMIVTASALPTKTQILDMLDKMAQQPQGPTPDQKAMLEKLMSEIQRNMAAAKKDDATAQKTLAEIPGVQAETQLTAAQARSEMLAPTMTNAMPMPGAGGFAFDDFAPPAAAGPTGDIGFPPLPEDGPPPF